MNQKQKDICKLAHGQLEEVALELEGAIDDLNTEITTAESGEDMTEKEDQKEELEGEKEQLDAALSELDGVWK